MKHALTLSAGLWLMAACSAHGAVEPKVLAQAETLKAQALNSDLAYEVLSSLTTEVGPRLGGTEAEARARDWSVTTLKGLELDKVRVETFKMPTWVRGSEQAAITAPFPQALYVTALGSSVGTATEGIKAELAVVENLEKLQALPEGALTGKLVYVGHRMRKTQDGSSYGFNVPLRSSGASIASEKGALGILIKSIGTSQHRFPHTGQMRYKDGVRKIPAAAISAPDAEQIERIAAMGETIEVHLTMTPVDKGQQESGNVIAEITGSEHPEQIVVIGGHLDSWDLGTGAVDDGAGIAITTAAAKLIKDFGVAPKRTIRLVHWGAEEVGLLGARAYAHAHAGEIEQHIVGAESDFGAGPIWQISAQNVGAENLPLVTDMLSVMRSLGIAKGAEDSAGGPDLIPLKQAGMPVIGLRQDGSDYFNLHHTPDDTLDKVNPEHLKQNVAAYAVFAWIAANADSDFR